MSMVKSFTRGKRSSAWSDLRWLPARPRPVSRRRAFVDAGLLALRATTGSLMIGHGSQKLFGAFGGYGLEGTAGWLESLGLRPGQIWAALAGLSEFGGGLLTTLGLCNPLGPVSIIGSMGMAIAKVHPLNKPIWVTTGGAEYPLTNIAIATMLTVAGPGKYSLDRVLNIHLPRWVALPGLAVSAGLIAYAASSTPAPQQEQEEQQVGEAEDQPDAGQGA